MSIIDYTTCSGHQLDAFVTPDGTPRVLARTIPAPGKLKAAVTWGDVNSANTIPRSEWAGLFFSASRPNVPVLNQGHVGSCASHAGVGALMDSRDQSGQAFELLSSSMVYAQVNDGLDRGSSLGDVVAALTSLGVCLDSEMPEGFYTKRAITQAMLDTARRFRVEPGDCYSLANWDEIVSASLLRYKIFLSVNVAGDWNQLDANGCPPFRRGSGNHAVRFGRGIRATKTGLILADGENSWSEQWGNQGGFSIYEDFIAEQDYMEAYAIRWPSQDPLDPNVGPITS